MARTNAQFSFISGEHDVYTTMARPEVAHRFCSRTRLSPLARKVEEHLREERTLRAAREERIAKKYRPVAPAPTTSKKKRRRPATKPVHVMFNNVTLDTSDVRELTNLVESLENLPLPFDDDFFCDEIDALEDRVEERLIGGPIVTKDECLEMRNKNKWGRGKQRRSRLAGYPGQMRYIIRVDGRTYTF